MLRHGELCVCEVERVWNISQSRASRHLRYLLNAGVVEDRREGLWVYYRVAQPASEQQRLLLEALRGLLRDIAIPDISPELESMRAQRCHPSPVRAEASTRRSAKIQ
jgi:ArsR family transcriptional regulator